MKNIGYFLDLRLKKESQKLMPSGCQKTRMKRSIEKELKMPRRRASCVMLGLSSIVDLSSEFSGGMCSWFGEEWPDLKAKALSQINIKPKKFGSAIESDINRIEEV
ncbi:5837_t:CDS:2 [Entrophospora sp. SA101]|nr:5837_t:CDS:2 [Entrophospora sp. SA101]